MSADGKPDLDAVVARVAEKLTRVTSSDCRTSHYFEMRNTDGEFVAAIHEDDLHTLLAAVKPLLNNTEAEVKPAVNSATGTPEVNSDLAAVRAARMARDTFEERYAEED